MMTGDLMGTEQAEIGFFDPDRNDAFTNIGAAAWNRQMGAQLQWLECRGRLKAAGRKIICNIRRSDLSSLSVFAGTDEGVQNRKLPYPEFRSIIHDSGSGENRVLPLPVHVVSPDRVVFIHRWTERVEDELCFLHRLYTMNPDAAASEQMIMLFHTREQTCRSLGTYYTPPELGKDNRCDLHPRWNPDQTLLSIDCVHEGSRQRYILDIASLVG